ncbi:MAG: hypothetical protein JO033_02170 [Acidobacteriaceae bacterium]|nr:hypothetical protein [Acidobacteriaceae bacterium]MBV9498021.1 hypothetical protein [Acidobacteriaceae bacterium]
MNEDVHARAKHLILADHVEHIAQHEREWLDQHLETCTDCDRLADATQKALRSLRAVSVPLPPSLASRAQLRVYLRIEELRTHRRGSWALWISCGLSWGFGAASTPYVWRGFQWAGQYIGVPNVVWQMGFGLWWALPALVAAGILLVEKLGEGSSETQ